VWSRLTEVFGSRFTREYGTHPNDSWRDVIARLSNEQIKRGLIALAEEGSEHPPNLPKFTKVCQHVHQMDVPKLEAPEYTLRDAQIDAYNAGVPRDLIPGKSMDELHQLELKARHGGFRGREQ